jgi:hypothetical protein
MKVVYSLELSIDGGEAKTRNLAVHGAGVRWSGLEAHLKAAAVDVDIKGIRVEKGKAECPESDADDADAGAED